jgi:hypothetical protein
VVITDWLDEIPKAAGNMLGSEDRSSICALEFPISQSLSGEGGIPDNVRQRVAVGVSWEADPKADLVGDGADGGVQIWIGMFGHPVFSF